MIEIFFRCTLIMILLALSIPTCFTQHTGTMYIRSASSPSTVLWAFHTIQPSSFPIVDTCRSCEDIARQSCAIYLLSIFFSSPRWRFLATFLRPVFAASRQQHISDLNSKFALGPHHVSKYGDIQPAAAEIRRGKKDIRQKIDRRQKSQGKNIMPPYYIGRP